MELRGGSSLRRERFRDMALTAFQRLAMLHRQFADYSANISSREGYSPGSLAGGSAPDRHLHRLTRATGARPWPSAGNPAGASSRRSSTRSPRVTALYEESATRRRGRPPPRLPEEEALEEMRPPSAHNIPLPTHPIRGEEELASIAGLLLNPDCRLLTPRGSGNQEDPPRRSGRVQAVVPGVRRASRRCLLCLLADLASPAHLVPAISAALRFSFQGALDPKTQLLDFLREKRMLLILDTSRSCFPRRPSLSEIIRAAPGKAPGHLMGVKLKGMGPGGGRAHDPRKEGGRPKPGQRPAAIPAKCPAGGSWFCAQEGGDSRPCPHLPRRTRRHAAVGMSWRQAGYVPSPCGNRLRDRA